MGRKMVERVFHCDWHECERHVRTLERHPPTFLTVASGVEADSHFCSWDCLLRFAAEKPPTEVVGVETD